MFIDRTGRLQQYAEKIEGIKINTSTLKCLGIQIGINKDFLKHGKRENLQFWVKQK